MKSICIYGNFNPAAQAKSDFWTRNINLKGYIYQKSIVAFDKPPLQFSRSDIVLKNQWAADQVYSDLTKNYVRDMINEPADYLVIDALGIIVPVKEVSANGISSYVTYNRYMQQVCERLQAKRKLAVSVNNINPSDDELREYVSAFCKSISTVYSPSQIIVHKANYPDYYIFNGKIVAYSDSEKRARNRQKNRINFVYEVLEHHFPEAKFIDMLPTACAKEKKNPFDYNKEYASYMSSAIAQTVFPEAANQLMRDIYNKYSIAVYDKSKKHESKEIDVALLVDSYEYKLEQYNEKFRLYEQKFLEMYNSFMGTDFEASKWEKDELSFAEFVALEKSSLKRTKKSQNILLHPFKMSKKFFSYSKRFGFKNALKRALWVVKGRK